MPEQRIGRGNVELESTSKERVDNKHRVGSLDKSQKTKDLNSNPSSVPCQLCISESVCLMKEFS